MQKYLGLSKSSFHRFSNGWMFLIFLDLLLLLWAGTGCVSGHCRTNQEAEKKKETTFLQQNNTNKAAPTIKVFKYDGSLQCGMGKAVSVEDMKSELKGLKIFSTANKNDGLMRIQLCGSPTGYANVYEILASDLTKAQSFGFREWTFD